MPGIVRTLQGAIVRRDMGLAMLVQQFANGTVDRNFAAADGELARLTRERGMSKPFDLGSGTRRGFDVALRAVSPSSPGRSATVPGCANPIRAAAISGVSSARAPTWAWSVNSAAAA